MSRGKLRVEFAVRWNKRFAQVLVSDDDGLVLTDIITAPDQQQFRKAVQDEILFYGSVKVVTL